MEGKSRRPRGRPTKTAPASGAAPATNSVERGLRRPGRFTRVQANTLVAQRASLPSGSGSVANPSGARRKRGHTHGSQQDDGAAAGPPSAAPGAGQPVQEVPHPAKRLKTVARALQQLRQKSSKSAGAAAHPDARRGRPPARRTVSSSPGLRTSAAEEALAWEEKRQKWAEEEKQWAERRQREDQERQQRAKERQEWEQSRAEREAERWRLQQAELKLAKREQTLEKQRAQVKDACARLKLQWAQRMERLRQAVQELPGEQRQALERLLDEPLLSLEEKEASGERAAAPPPEPLAAATVISETAAGGADAVFGRVAAACLQRGPPGNGAAAAAAAAMAAGPLAPAAAAVARAEAGGLPPPAVVGVGVAEVTGGKPTGSSPAADRAPGGGVSCAEASRAAAAAEASAPAAGAEVSVKRGRERPRKVSVASPQEMASEGAAPVAAATPKRQLRSPAREPSPPPSRRRRNLDDRDPASGAGTDGADGRRVRKVRQRLSGPDPDGAGAAGGSPSAATPDAATAAASATSEWFFNFPNGTAKYLTGIAAITAAFPQQLRQGGGRGSLYATHPAADGGSGGSGEATAGAPLQAFSVSVHVNALGSAKLSGVGPLVRCLGLQPGDRARLTLRGPDRMPVLERAPPVDHSRVWLKSVFNPNYLYVSVRTVAAVLGPEVARSPPGALSFPVHVEGPPGQPPGPCMGRLCSGTHTNGSGTCWHWCGGGEWLKEQLAGGIAAAAAAGAGEGPEAGASYLQFRAVRSLKSAVGESSNGSGGEAAEGSADEEQGPGSGLLLTVRFVQGSSGSGSGGGGGGDGPEDQPPPAARATGARCGRLDGVMRRKLGKRRRRGGAAGAAGSERRATASGSATSSSSSGGTARGEDETPGAATAGGSRGAAFNSAASASLVVDMRRPTRGTRLAGPADLLKLVFPTRLPEVDSRPTSHVATLRILAAGANGEAAVKGEDEVVEVSYSDATGFITLTTGQYDRLGSGCRVRLTKLANGAVVLRAVAGEDAGALEQ